MSYDVFFHRITQDGSGRGSGNLDAMRALDAFLVRNQEGVVTHIRTPDGTAEIFGLNGSDGFMASHVEGDATWDALVDAAREGGFAIMAVGRPVCVTSADLAQDVPCDLVADEPVRIVANGKDLIAVIDSG